MAHPVNAFINPTPGSQEHNAVVKATEEQPRVRLIGTVDNHRFYLVNSTRELDVSYVVRLWEDEDRDLYSDLWGNLHVAERGEFWIECYCSGASPRIDDTAAYVIGFTPWAGLVLKKFNVGTGVAGWVPKSCYHQAAVLIFGDW